MKILSLRNTNSFFFIKHWSVFWTADLRNLMQTNRGATTTTCDVGKSLFSGPFRGPCHLCGQPWVKLPFSHCCLMCKTTSNKEMWNRGWPGELAAEHTSISTPSRSHWVIEANDSATTCHCALLTDKQLKHFNEFFFVSFLTDCFHKLPMRGGVDTFFLHFPKSTWLESTSIFRKAAT